MHKLIALFIITVVSITLYLSVESEDLVESALVNDIELIREALEGGESINTANSNGTSVLMAASIKGHTELVDYLLKSGANPNITNLQGVGPLYSCSMLGLTEIVKKLLAHGANPNVEIKAVNATPLMIAVANNETEIVSILLKHGAKLNIENIEGKTAIELAKSKEIYEILEHHTNGS